MARADEFDDASDYGSLGDSVLLSAGARAVAGFPVRSIEPIATNDESEYVSVSADTDYGSAVGVANFAADEGWDTGIAADASFADLGFAASASSGAHLGAAADADAVAVSDEEFGSALDSDEERELSRLVAAVNTTDLRPASHLPLRVPGRGAFVVERRDADSRFARQGRRRPGAAAGYPEVDVVYEDVGDFVQVREAVRSIHPTTEHGESPRAHPGDAGREPTPRRDAPAADSTPLPHARATEASGLWSPVPQARTETRPAASASNPRPASHGRSGYAAAFRSRPAEPRGDGRSAAAATRDVRTPLERFRRSRPLSVTDITSPSWCELQWSYTLSKHGRRVATPAMKSGTRVHQRLEREVHDVKPVEVKTREDRFGLRIWNVVQGLSALRDGGVTRELEVWGEVDGQVVNGVVDELSYVCPDRELEDSARARERARADLQSADAADALDPDRMVLAEPLDVEDGQELDQLKNGAEGKLQKQPRRTLRRLQSLHRRTDKVYVCDVKTRASASLPQGGSFRPTLLQLMLYRFLLAEMVSSAVSIDSLAARYAFVPDASFSDAFVAQIASLNLGFHDAPSNSQETSSQPASSQDPLDVLLLHNSPRKLWDFLMHEMKRTIPDGAKGLGDVLKAEYRDGNSGEIKGMKTFLYDEETILDYVRDGLSWWRGQREPMGVPEDEAYKCKSCEFSEGCEWRLGKVEEAMEKLRERTRSRV